MTGRPPCQALQGPPPPPPLYSRDCPGHRLVGTKGSGLQLGTALPLPCFSGLGLQFPLGSLAGRCPAGFPWGHQAGHHLRFRTNSSPGLGGQARPCTSSSQNLLGSRLTWGGSTLEVTSVLPLSSGKRPCCPSRHLSFRHPRASLLTSFFFLSFVPSLMVLRSLQPGLSIDEVPACPPHPGPLSSRKGCVRVKPTEPSRVCVGPGTGFPV